MAPTHIFHPLPAPQDNGAAIQALFQAGGEGTTVLLVQGSIYHLTTAIDLCHAGTTLATEGYPSFESGRQAVLETRGEKEAGAVNLFNKSGTALRRVHVRGCRGWGRTKPATKEEEEDLRRKGALGWIEGSGALVWMGGPAATDQLLEGCRLEDPRGWTACHVTDWADRCKVVDNIVGPCGQQAGGGPWADGLSIAGRNSLISGNTIIDATDGAIVIFCAPGSTVVNNTIIARTRDCLGAINLVDDFPFQCDYTGTTVVANTIRTEGDAYIRLAIGCGPTCWSPWQPFHTLNHSGQVLHNNIGPGAFGYGVALSGVKNFKVLGNAIQPGARFEGNLGMCLGNAPPMAFLTEWPDRNRVVECEIQPEFVKGEAQWLIGSDPGRGDRLIYEEGQIDWTPGAAGAWVKGGRWHLSAQGELVLEDGGSGAVAWRSGPTVSLHDKPELKFSEDGKVVIRTASGSTLWSPSAYLDSSLATMGSLPAPPPRIVKADAAPTSANKDAAGHASLILGSEAPFLQMKSADGALLFSSSYEFGKGWEMKEGDWLAIAPESLRGVVPPPHAQQQPGAPPVPERPSHLLHTFAHDLKQAWHDASAPPPVPPRPAAPQPPTTFFVLSTTTHQLILHSSPSPAHPEQAHIHWASPLPDASEVKTTWLVLQTDGNLVHYCEWAEGGTGVLWASGTNGGEHEAEYIAFRAQGEKGGPARVEMLAGDERGRKVVWTSLG